MAQAQMLASRAIPDQYEGHRVGSAGSLNFMASERTDSASYATASSVSRS